MRGVRQLRGRIGEWHVGFGVSLGWCGGEGLVGYSKGGVSFWLVVRGEYVAGWDWWIEFKWGRVGGVLWFGLRCD
jgi:hypothetical protein